MEFKDLEFSASDFTAAPTGGASKMADWVNKKLARKLEKAPVVYSGKIGDEKEWSVTDTWKTTWHDVSQATHKARLICIAETKTQ